MNTATRLVKRFIYGLAVVLLSLFVYTGITVITLSINLTNSDVVKNWPKQAGTYDVITENLLKLAQNPETEQSLESEIEQGILDMSALTAALAEVYTGDYWQSKFETVIDAHYDWLEGRSDRPTFVLDFTDRNDALAEALRPEVVRQLETAPVCTLGTIPDRFDPLSADCIPPGVSVDDAADVLIDSLIYNEESFFSEAKIDSADIDYESSPLFGGDLLEKGPQVYAGLQNAVWYFAGLVLVLGAIIILTATRPLRGLRRIGQSLFSAGLVSWVSFFIAGRLVAGEISVDGDAPEQEFARNVLLPLLKEVVADISRSGLWVSLVVAITGIMAWLAAFTWHKVHHHKEAKKIAERAMRSSPGIEHDPELPEPVDPDKKK